MSSIKARIPPLSDSSEPFSSSESDTICVNDSVRTSHGNLLDTYGNEFEIPEYSFKQIKEAIPAHCFERSALTGYRYVAQDLFLLITTFCVFNMYVTASNVASWHLRFVLWSLYTFLQGLFAIGIWVIAHECGHQAFSDYKALNDTTGWILHSLLLVPYFSWKITHKQHHALHNNLAKDMQFVPKSREQYGRFKGKDMHSSWELTEEMPLRTAIELFAQQIVGWPRYLLTFDSGSLTYVDKVYQQGVDKHNTLKGKLNHVDPRSPLFTTDEAHLIILSDCGVGITLAILAYIHYKYGWANVTVWYWIPYLWVNHWLGTLFVTSPQPLKR